MTDLHSTAPVSAGAEAPGTGVRHPATFAPATFILLLVLSAFGAIIGVQLILQLGVTPNTSIIGALIAMLLARVPIAIFARYRSIHVQNLAQSAISAATFGAANSLLLPIGVPFLLGRSDLILPMLIGAALSMLLDAYLLYRMFDTRVFPATGTWPPGVAAAEAIKAGDEGGRKAALLGAGILVGVFGSWLKIPMSAFGVAFIGNVWALSMFGVGLLIRGYTQPLTGIDISKYYVPHGFMVGAGLVALVQVIATISRRGGDEAAAGRSDAELGRALGLGSIGYPVIAILIATLGGLATQMSVPMLILFIIYAAFAAFIHELLVGIAAMHSGWFPAFAIALITLIIGILIGFPPIALGLLVGFSASTGPAFADMGYDLRAGFILRGFGKDPGFELEGRRQQLYAAMLAFLIAIPTVWFAHPGYFAQGLVPPVDRVYVAAINAAASLDVARLLWLCHPQRDHPMDRRAEAPARRAACDRIADPQSARRLGGACRHRHSRRRAQAERRTGDQYHGGAGRRLHWRRCAVRLLRFGPQDETSGRQMTAELISNLERRVTLRRTLGTLTIGQAPRSDIAPTLRQHVPVGVEIVDSGLLDGLSHDEIRSRYGTEDGKPVLLTRLLDGSSVQLSARKIRDGIQAKLSALEAGGCDVILLLCTGQFQGLSCDRAWLLEPDRIIPPAVSGLVQDRQLGVIVPLLSQMDSESGKWTVLPRMPIFAAASPYDDPPETLRSAGRSLEQRGAQALLLDCIGFTEEERRELANGTGLPVILSNAVMAKLVGELLAA